MKSKCPFLPLLTLTLLAQAFGGEAEPTAGEAAAPINEFAFALYPRLARQPGNLCFSPFSIETCLAMTYAGARGQTALQMAEALHLSGKTNAIHSEVAAALKEFNRSSAYGCQLVAANAIWLEQGFPFVAAFQELLQNQYGASLKHFEPGRSETTRKEINSWVADQTHDKITEIVPPTLPDANTRLMLVNAVYFKGAWSNPFPTSLTSDARFRPASGQPVSVPTMHVESIFSLSEDAELQMLELPYFSHEVGMLILLPKKSDGLSQLEEGLTAARVEQLYATSVAQRVSISLPKFKENSAFDLRGHLRAMGMKDAFDKADFSGIAKGEELFIQAVIHEAYVNVDERGTEAAAATHAGLGSGLQISPPTVFNADHPFLFLIRHNPTGIILFLGRVSNPVS